MDGAAHRGRIVHKIEDPIGLVHSIDVQPVHAEQLNQQRPIQRIPRDVVQVHPGSGIVVPDVQAEILFTQSKRLHGVDVLHHDFPERGLIAVAQPQLRDARLEHLQHQGVRRGITVLRNRTHLVGLTAQRVFIRYGEDLRVVQCLPQRDESQTCVVGKLRWSKLSCIPHAFVMDALVQSQVHSCNGPIGSGKPENVRVIDHHVEELVVRICRVAQVRHGIPDQRLHWQVRGNVIGVLT